MQEVIDELYEGFALGIYRVRTLESIMKALAEKYNANNARMTWEQENMWIARMQSVMRDIREEMASFDEVVTRVILRQVVTKQYQKYEPLDKKDAEKLIERLGGSDKALEAIRKEQAKRERLGLKD